MMNKRWLSVMVGILMILSVFVSCSKKAITDYTAVDAYKTLFTDGEEARVTELKNVLIEHFQAYNTGDAKGYYTLFNMEKEDLNFNVTQLQSMQKNYQMTNTIESIETAFMNDDNAQALITMTCRADEKTSGAVLYYYRTELVYTMTKNGGQWKVTQQSVNGEFDLMDTLESDTVQTDA